MSELSKTFEFTEADYLRIALKDSLFTDAITPPDLDSIALTRKLGKLLDTENRLYLHAVSLSDHIRAKMIPRGLRITKKPFLGLENKEFCDRWCEILNKCSLDLMALTISELSTDLNSVRDQVADAKKEISEKIQDKERFEKLMEDCDKHKKTLEEELKSFKRQKFEQVRADYEGGTVYRWRLPKTGENQARQRGRRTKQWHSFSSRDSDSSTNTEHAHSTAFLAQDQHTRGRPPKSQTRGRGRGAAGANGYQNYQRDPLTRRLNRS